MFVIQAWAGPGTGTHICRVSVSGEQVKLFGGDIRELRSMTGEVRPFTLEHSVTKAIHTACLYYASVSSYVLHVMNASFGTIINNAI